MTMTTPRILAISVAAASAAFLGSALFSPLAQAQAVYRIVGPDGKVTFSDKPPVSASAGQVAPAGGAGAASGGALPYELRQVVAKYPVTFYSADNCGPCASARSLLITRGIPFSEKTVNTNDDTQALQRLSGENSLPFATIGSQQLKGFSDAEWSQFLDAAGYPKTSMLPPGFRRGPATPLVAVSAAPAQAASAARPATRPAPTPATPPPSADNPAGIKF
jgi:glutaredoxin